MIVESLKSLGLITAALVFLLFWAGSFVYVYLDVSRRDLSEGRQFVWLTLVALVPVLGYLIYRAVYRLSGLPWLKRWRAALPDQSEHDPWSTTQPMRRPAPQDVHQSPIEVGWVPLVPNRPDPPVERRDTQPVLVFSNEQDMDATPPSGTRLATQAVWKNDMGVPIQLRVVYGPYSGEIFYLKTLPASIGRGSQANLAMDDDLEVSRLHAEIYSSPVGLRIRDLNSLHGTFINGIQIEDASLNPGDQIWLGASLMQLEA